MHEDNRCVEIPASTLNPSGLIDEIHRRGSHNSGNDSAPGHSKTGYIRVTRIEYDAVRATRNR